MNRTICSIWACVIVLIVVVACSKKGSAPEVVVEIPTGFSGNVLLEMGVNDAPPLAKRGQAYVVVVPKSGRVTTSTLLTTAQPTFQNYGEGAVWGYSHSVFATGDGIPVSGKIEFFVGTRKQYDAEQNKKNHSEGFSTPQEATA